MFVLTPVALYMGPQGTTSVVPAMGSDSFSHTTHHVHFNCRYPSASFGQVKKGANMSFGQYSLQLIAKYSKDMFTVLKITITWNEEHVSWYTHMYMAY